MKKLITGLNHLTIAVSDLSRSFDFYVEVLGFEPQGLWNEGAYLSAGDLWLCLILENAIPAKDYTHYAFSVNDIDFASSVRKLEDYGSTCWKNNVSEGSSHYFLDPDGHKLEIHCGDLKSRLKAVELKPYSGWSYPK